MKTQITRIFRQVDAFLRRYLRSTNAVAAVEFALIVPVMLALYGGGSYLATAVTINKKLQNASYTMINLVPYPRDYCTYRQFVAQMYATGYQRQLMEQFLFPLPISDQPDLVGYVEGPADAEGLVPVTVQVKYEFNGASWRAFDQLSVIQAVRTISAESPAVTVKKSTTPCANPTLVLDGPAVVEVTVDEAINAAVQANNGVPPYRYSIGPGLPTGLQFDASLGTVFGVPQATCSVGPCDPYSVTVRFWAQDSTSRVWTNEPDQTATRDVVFTVIHPLRLAIVPMTGTVNVDLTSPFPGRSGGKPGYTYTATGLPPGLSIHPGTGVISGKPSAPGNYDVAVTVTDVRGVSAASSAMYTIAPPPLSAWATSPVVMLVGQPYSWAFGVNGGWGGITFACTGVPAGMSCDGNARVVNGTPTQVRTGRVTITATDSWGQSATAFMDYDVRYDPLTLAVSGGLSGEINNYKAATWSSTGGNGAVSFTCFGLPPGLECDTANRRVHGTPPYIGSGTITIRAQDQFGQIVDRYISYNFTPNPFTISVVWEQYHGLAGYYHQARIYSSGAYGGISNGWCTGQPAGIACNTTHVYGTPNPAGPGYIYVTLVDGLGRQATVPVWYNFPAPTLSTSKSGDMSGRCCDTSYTRYVYSAGGWGAKSASRSGLPAGMSFGWDGNTAWVTGTPSSAGSGSITVTIRDSAGQASSQVISYNFSAITSPVTITSTLASGQSLWVNFSEGIQIVSISSNHSATTGNGAPWYSNTLVSSSNLSAHTFTITIRDQRGLTKAFSVNWPNLGTSDPPCRPGRCG
ncbi:putative Ig domain-containing protein [Microvirga tunisiensis]|uniref:Pilus assembly protein n=1 Tax=Microvirga tunisiensis TaxID=2108360 RepID=A0A5N7MRR1_9HYPH|nr:putative Ig domain-containing protein [Microvirga tunisiensis]MPR09225.1 hypothetical protein [Microvirga tunisiensis]MPR28794.1 hypothetical protein [Microvirga tunisiensis]